MELLLKNLNRVWAQISSRMSLGAIDPYRDWRALVLAFGVLFVLTAGVHAYVLYRFEHEDGVENASSASALNSDTLKQVGEIMRARTAATETLSRDGFSIIDPSQ